MATKRAATATKTVETSDFEAILSQLGLEVAKVKIGADLEEWVSSWIRLILTSDLPEHKQIRAELIQNVSRIYVARTLQDCFTGAIADSNALLSSSTAQLAEKEAA